MRTNQLTSIPRHKQIKARAIVHVLQVTTPRPEPRSTGGRAQSLAYRCVPPLGDATSSIMALALILPMVGNRCWLATM